MNQGDGDGNTRQRLKRRNEQKNWTSQTGHFDLTTPEWYLNRELSWLEFNRRVFNESRDERNPLLERVFFSR